LFEFLCIDAPPASGDAGPREQQTFHGGGSGRDARALPVRAAHRRRAGSRGQRRLAGHKEGRVTSAVFTVTAYCAGVCCCGPQAAGITASGLPVRVGWTVAAPPAFRFGTQVYISGLGWRSVEDRTHRRYAGRFDVYVVTHREAVWFGKKRLRVYWDANPRAASASPSQPSPRKGLKITPGRSGLMKNPTGKCREVSSGGGCTPL